MGIPVVRISHAPKLLILRSDIKERRVIQHVNVSVDDAFIDRFSEVTKWLRAAGLHVERESAPIGVVSGSIDSEHVKDLASVDGVESIEVDREYRLPPVDSYTR